MSSFSLLWSRCAASISHLPWFQQFKIFLSHIFRSTSLGAGQASTSPGHLGHAAMAMALSLPSLQPHGRATHQVAARCPPGHASSALHTTRISPPKSDFLPYSFTLTLVRYPSLTSRRWTPVAAWLQPDYTVSAVCRPGPPGGWLMPPGEPGSGRRRAGLGPRRKPWAAHVATVYQRQHMDHGGHSRECQASPAVSSLTWCLGTPDVNLLMESSHEVPGHTCHASAEAQLSHCGQWAALAFPKLGGVGTRGLLK